MNSQNIVRYWHAVELLQPQAVPVLKKRDNLYQPFFQDVRPSDLALPWDAENTLSHQRLPQKRVWSHTLYAHLYDNRDVSRQLDSIVAFTTKHPYQFGKSNIHFICRMTPMTQRIAIQDTDEIEEAKWVALPAYLEDSGNSLSNRQLVSDVAFSQGLVYSEYSSNSGVHKKQEIFTAAG